MSKRLVFGKYEPANDADNSYRETEGTGGALSVINRMIDAACGYDPAVEQVKSEASMGAADVLVDLSEAARFYVETGDDSAIRQAVELLRFMGWYAAAAQSGEDER